MNLNKKKNAGDHAFLLGHLFSTKKFYNTLPPKITPCPQHWNSTCMAKQKGRKTRDKRVKE
jgi:hypothetical protein